MKEIFKTFISLIALLIISSLVYLAWILHKGEFSSQYLENFINDRFKSENFTTSIQNPIIKFDKKKKSIVIDGKNFTIFSIDKKKVSEFENLKVHINILPLITDRKLVTNKIEMIDGVIDLPNVFKKPLNVNNILLEGNLNPNDKEIYLENFSSSINKDFYQGSAKLDLKNFEVSGNLNKLERKNIFYGLDLNSNKMNFNINKNDFEIEGNAIIGDTNVFLKGSKNYKNTKKYISKYSISGNISEKDIEKYFNLKTTPYFSGPIELNATYYIFENNKEKIQTSNSLKEAELNIPALNLIKNKNIDASADIDFIFLSKELNEIKITNYKSENYELDGVIKLSKQIKPYKSLDFNIKNNNKKLSIKILRDKVLNKIILIGDYFDFSKILKETFFEEQKEDSFLIKLQPVSIDLNAKEILVSEEKSIFNVNSKMRYDNKLFKKVTLEAKLKNDKNFNINIKNHNESRELNIFSDDAGNFLNTFNINKSGKGGEFVLHGNYDDTKESNPLKASVTIREMRLIKAPTLATILNLASIGIVSALSGEGILINKVKSEFLLENGILNLEKYEAYGPDIGFSNQGKVFLKKEEIDLEGAIIPMVTLNKVIGSIPVLGKILTNERKGIWSFVYTITGDLDEPTVKVNPIKTITPGFIQKFFSVFKTEKKEEEN
tara:strand:+ start:1267 stop:3258 length:1992 start_codon:yes stop_codon:yes gene_type:complete